MKYAVMTHIF